jgi:hypothetical protein
MTAADGMPDFSDFCFGSGIVQVCFVAAPPVDLLLPSMIGLDSPTINNTGSVFANGASGGEGSGQTTPGNFGPEPTSAAPSAAPVSGTNNGGDGGGGTGTGTNTGDNGKDGAGGGLSGGGGGGGGGGLGVIKVYRGTLGGQCSPAPT